MRTTITYKEASVFFETTYANKCVAKKNRINYTTFGAPMSQRTFNSSQYRFSFNGKEKLDETYEDGNEYDFGNRIYSLRLAKWISLDPLQ